MHSFFARNNYRVLSHPHLPEEVWPVLCQKESTKLGLQGPFWAGAIAHQPCTRNYLSLLGPPLQEGPGQHAGYHRKGKEHWQRESRRGSNQSYNPSKAYSLQELQAQLPGRAT